MNHHNSNQNQPMDCSDSAPQINQEAREVLPREQQVEGRFSLCQINSFGQDPSDLRASGLQVNHSPSVQGPTFPRGLSRLNENILQRRSASNSSMSVGSQQGQSCRRSHYNFHKQNVCVSGENPFERFLERSQQSSRDQALSQDFIGKLESDFSFPDLIQPNDRIVPMEVDEAYITQGNNFILNQSQAGNEFYPFAKSVKRDSIFKSCWGPQSDVWEYDPDGDCIMAGSALSNEEIYGKSDCLQLQFNDRLNSHWFGNAGRLYKNPYLNFMRDYKELKRGISFSTITKQAAKAWRNMPHSMKRKYFLEADLASEKQKHKIRRPKTKSKHKRSEGVSRGAPVGVSDVSPGGTISPKSSKTIFEKIFSSLFSNLKRHNDQNENQNQNSPLCSSNETIVVDSDRELSDRDQSAESPLNSGASSLPKETNKVEVPPKISKVVGQDVNNVLNKSANMELLFNKKDSSKINHNQTVCSSEKKALNKSQAENYKPKEQLTGKVGLQNPESLNAYKNRTSSEDNDAKSLKLQQPLESSHHFQAVKGGQHIGEEYRKEIKSKESNKAYKKKHSKHNYHTDFKKQGKDGGLKKENKTFLVTETKHSKAYRRAKALEEAEFMKMVERQIALNQKGFKVSDSSDICGTVDDFELNDDTPYKEDEEYTDLYSFFEEDDHQNEGLHTPSKKSAKHKSKEHKMHKKKHAAYDKRQQKDILARSEKYSKAHESFKILMDDFNHSSHLKLNHSGTNAINKELKQDLEGGREYTRQSKNNDRYKLRSRDSCATKNTAIKLKESFRNDALSKLNDCLDSQLYENVRQNQEILSSKNPKTHQEIKDPGNIEHTQGIKPIQEKQNAYRIELPERTQFSKNHSSVKDIKKDSMHQAENGMNSPNFETYRDFSNFPKEDVYDRARYSEYSLFTENCKYSEHEFDIKNTDAKANSNIKEAVSRKVRNSLNEQDPLNTIKSQNSKGTKDKACVPPLDKSGEQIRPPSPEEHAFNEKCNFATELKPSVDIQLNEDLRNEVDPPKKTELKENDFCRDSELSEEDFADYMELTMDDDFTEDLEPTEDMDMMEEVEDMDDTTSIEEMEQSDDMNSTIKTKQTNHMNTNPRMYQTENMEGTENIEESDYMEETENCEPTEDIEQSSTMLNVEDHEEMDFSEDFNENLGIDLAADMDLSEDLNDSEQISYRGSNDRMLISDSQSTELTDISENTELSENTKFINKTNYIFNQLNDKDDFSNDTETFEGTDFTHITYLTESTELTENTDEATENSEFSDYDKGTGDSDFLDATDQTGDTDLTEGSEVTSGSDITAESALSDYGNTEDSDLTDTTDISNQGDSTRHTNYQGPSRYCASLKAASLMH